MRYITKVEIRGWQSHAHTVLHLHPGINAITGSSNAGKSTVFRAIKWCLNNEAPEGPVEDWQRRGATLTQVTVTFSDGLTITRERRVGRNIYKVTAPDGKQTDLADFGTVLPPQVAQHGMLPVIIDQDLALNLHYASQMEPAMFVASPPYSAPARARILGYLSGVGVIDRAQRTAKADLLAIGQSVKSQEAELARLSGQLSAYAGLDAQDAAMQQAEALLAQLPEIGQRITRLQEIAQRRQEAQVGIAQAQAALTRLSGVDQAAVALAQLEAIHQRRDHLRSIAQRLADARQGIAAAQAILDRTAGVELADRAIRLIPVYQKLIAARRGMDATQAILDRTAGVKQAENLLSRIVVFQSLISARQGIAQAQRTLDRTVGTDTTEALIAGLQDMIGTRQKLAALHQRITEAQAGRQQAEATLDRLSGLPEAEKALTRLEALRQRCKEFQIVQVKIRNAREQVGTADMLLIQADQRLQSATDAYIFTLEEARICPTCRQPITSDTVAHIAAEITEVHAHG